MGEGSWCLVHSVDYSAESPGYSDLRVCRVLLADVLNAELNNERRPTTVSGVGRERERRRLPNPERENGSTMQTSGVFWEFCTIYFDMVLRGIKPLFFGNSKYNK